MVVEDVQEALHRDHLDEAAAHDGLHVDVGVARQLVETVARQRVARPAGDRAVGFEAVADRRAHDAVVDEARDDAHAAGFEGDAVGHLGDVDRAAVR